VRLEPIPGGFFVRAPAKLNLHLEVLGDRPDGYHEIESIFHAIGGAGEARALEDELEVVAGRPGVEFTCSTKDPSIPTGRENLACRAAESVLALAPRGAGLRVALRKRIPAGSGLGGGSSDAAAVLVAGARVLGIDSSPASLRDAAASIGSDVPFFLRGGTALVRGRGEIVEPLEVTRTLAFGVVVPAQFVSTKEIYDALPSLTRPPGAHKILLTALVCGSVREVSENLFNRLEEIVCDRFPAIRDAQSRLQSLVASPVRVTGSGSALYFVCETRKEARHTVDRIDALGLGRSWIAESEPTGLAQGAGTAGKGEHPWTSPKSGSS
jgi:4-diphosphocytidyl-2-C-methyl-D-erythritol kinase